MTHFSYKRDETSSINLQQLYRLFDTEKRNIINVLQYLKLLSQSYRCPVCNQDMKLVERTQLKDRYEWQCTKNNDRDILEHHVVRSLREGTWFSQSELTLEQVTLLTYFWVKELPLKFVLEETRISSGTVGDYFIYCREFCDIILTQKENKIGGEKHIIEIEESPFPKREYHGDKRIYKKWVYGGVDRETGECFLHPVENKSAATLLTVIKERILPGTTIYSDCWKSYDCLSHKAYNDLTAKYSITFKDKEINFQTNTIDGMWKSAKEKMSSKISRTPQFNSYLCELMYRRSRGEENRFMKFIKDIAAVYTPSAQD